MFEARLVDRKCVSNYEGEYYCNRDKCWRERVLQYRVLNDDGSPIGHLNWSDWQDIPTVREP